MAKQISYSLKELCRVAEVTERTVRYYISEGLLPPPTGTGPFSRYGYEHWLRLAYIRRLKDEYLPLSEIKNLLAGRSLEELDTLARRTGLIGGQVSEQIETKDKPGDSGYAYLENLLRTGPAGSLRKQLAADKDDEAQEQEEESPEIDPTTEITGSGGFPVTLSSPAWEPTRPAPSAPMPMSYSPPPPMSGPSKPAMRAFSAMPPSPPPGSGNNFRDQSMGGVNYFAKSIMPTPGPMYNQPPPPNLPPEPEEAVSQNWERITIAPGIELHVESSIAEKNRSALSLLLQEIRRLFNK